MREIIFRGKHTDTGEWVYGDLIHRTLWDKSLIIIRTYDYSFDTYKDYDVIPKSVGQYTGLTDKNDVKIFEGDICRFREWSNGDMCWIGKVHYEHQQFVISGGKNKECDMPFTLMMSCFISENIEVIGDICDNPELINKM